MEYPARIAISCDLQTKNLLPASRESRELYLASHLGHFLGELPAIDLRLERPKFSSRSINASGHLCGNHRLPTK
jgi:hypothetical protein